MRYGSVSSLRVTGLHSLVARVPAKAADESAPNAPARLGGRGAGVAPKPKTWPSARPRSRGTVLATDKGKHPTLSRSHRLVPCHGSRLSLAQSGSRGVCWSIHDVYNSSVAGTLLRPLLRCWCSVLLVLGTSGAVAVLCRFWNILLWFLCYFVMFSEYVVIFLFMK